MEPLPQTQSIAGVFTPRLVARLHREGFEGTLRLHAAGATRVIYFRRGDIASAASNAEEDRLHNLLIREGRLTGPQVEMARSRQRPGASLGKVLIELGFLTPSELLQGARRQVRQILAACFALTEGNWQTVPGPLGPEVTNLGLPARRLIFDALMEAGDRRAIVREMGSMESVYRPTAALAEALPTLRLEPTMEEVARMIDGRATLREISSRTRLDDFTVSRIVLALDILGLAGLATRSEPAVAARPGRVIPVESDDDHAAPVAVRPTEVPAPAPDPPPAAAPAPAVAAAFTPEAPQRPAAPASPGVAPATLTVTGEGGETIRLAAKALPAVPRPAGEREVPLPSAAEASPALPSEARTPAPAPAPAPSEPDGSAEPEPEEAAPARLPEAEPPPFPRGELPAFADGLPDDRPVWTINPETGERVHEGPIELTFDGPLAPGRSGRTNARFLIAGVLALVVVAVVGVFISMRSGRPDSSTAGRDTLAETDAGTTPAGIAAHPDTPPPVDAGRASETAGGGADDAGASGSAPVEAAPPAAAPPQPEAGTATGPVTAGDSAPAPDRRTDPGAARESGADPKPAAATTGSGDPRLAPGQARLDAGDVAGAERAFRAALNALPADGLTLQLMIACEEATVRKARAALAPDEPLFVTPFTLQGRPCHRILWGIYDDRDAAQAGAATLPAYFAGAGIKPVAISIGRLRAPS